MNTSVIVTTYKRPGALKKVLEGLRHQSVLPGEVIVADDGSGPDTGEMVHRLKNDSPYPLHHVWQEDKGFRAAEIRNKSILASQGDYIICLDGDCVPGKHFISDHRKLAEQGYFFQGKRILVKRSLVPLFTHKEANSVAKLLWYALTNKIKNCHHIIRMTPFFSTTSTRLKGIKSCNMGFFRSDLFAVNGFNQDFVGWGREDSELAVRLFRYGLKRKGHQFMAICFHLWHEEHNRDQLSINDELLSKALKGNRYFCRNGLVNR
ncbi:MAG: glycosyltransferase family 2 protein [Desulfobacterales bacterium]|nr:MAG: glycosyltransferase family 2 protein [Desulfobacterales bacterium]